MTYNKKKRHYLEDRTKYHNMESFIKSKTLMLHLSFNEALPCNHIIVEVDMDPKVPHGNVRFPLTNNLEVIKY